MFDLPKNKNSTAYSFHNKQATELNFVKDKLFTV